MAHYCTNYEHHSTQYSLIHSAGQSSGLGLRAKQTTLEFSGTPFCASARQSTTCLGQRACTQSALLMVISSQKSKRTMNLLIYSKLSLRAWYTGTKISSSQIITELLYPSLWFFSHARSPVLRIANSPPYSNISSRFPVIIMSRSMQNLRPFIPWSLNKVTLPHHFFHPSYKAIGFMSGCKSVGSSVKQQKSTSQVVYLLMPAYSLFTYDAGQRVPHFTDNTLIFFSPQYGTFSQGFICKAWNPLQSGLIFWVASTICYQVLLIASSFRPSWRRISVKLTTEDWLSGCRSKAF